MATLYIVATPIGNLEDISDRAKKTLAEVDLIAAEDTRHSQKLLNHLGISQRVVAYHDHNEENAAAGLISELDRGKDIALISDAGTPLISDPGYRVVLAARQQGYEVRTIPGPSALIAALSISGLPSDKFMFQGFVPRKSRQQKFGELSAVDCTMIFYEAPNRLSATLADMLSVFGADRTVIVARELTKTYEQVVRGSLQEVVELVANGSVPQKGEMVILLAGVEGKPDIVAGEDVLRILLEEQSVSKAAEIASRITGVSRKSLYQRALTIKTELE